MWATLLGFVYLLIGLLPLLQFVPRIEMLGSLGGRIGTLVVLSFMHAQHFMATTEGTGHETSRLIAMRHQEIHQRCGALFGFLYSWSGGAYLLVGLLSLIVGLIAKMAF